MKFDLPNEPRSRTLSNILTVAAGMLMYGFILSFKSIVGAASTLMSVLTPFLIGVGLAFMLIPLVTVLDKIQSKLYCRRKDYPRIRRTISTLLSVIFFVSILSAFFSILLPQLVTSAKQTVGLLNQAMQTYSTELNRLLGRYEIFSFDGINFSFDWDTIMAQVTNYFDVYAQYLISISASVYQFVFKILMGLITSIYILMDKEHLCAQAKKITYAVFPRHAGDILVYWMRKAGHIFSGFISGKIFDSIIIGVLCYLGMIIMRLEYAVLISFVIGLTNIIPFFGPFIGAIPCALILLIINPYHALFFVIFAVVLQQLDGNIIGPRILGDSVGIQPLWIMTSIMAGGSLFGFVGMLFAVPAFAFFYAVVRALAELGLSRRGMPSETEHYLTYPEKQEEHHASKGLFRRNRKTARK